ncbi:hypothetical protein [Vulgatibacter incomptus]|uniref:Uncharacterized protein n=1 Tax=Vulgatibacter incomptus TaxID=1391653 RepID=A0A0K1PCR1_9BACT|nr:hypothetical protein [Vulgatibacter incomptus]AKU91305.1 hypothetical protein AKJ08_1692 [Vulgatibacter incomptus]
MGGGRSSSAAGSPSRQERPRERTSVVEPGSVDEPLVQGGRYVFDADDGFRVVFRPADRWRLLAAFVVTSLAIVGFTVAILLREPKFEPLAWGIAATGDFAVICALHIVRMGLAKGRIAVDAAEQRIFLPQGAEVAFDRLRSLKLTRRGGLAEIVLVHEEGLIRFGARPAAESELAAAAIARITGLPIN